MKRNLPYIATALRRARTAAGLSQHQLAMLADVSRPTIAGIELGTQRNVKSDTLRKLAKALNMSISDLIGPNDENADTLVDEFIQSPLAQMLAVSAQETEWLKALQNSWPTGRPSVNSFYHLIEALRQSQILGDKDPS